MFEYVFIRLMYAKIDEYWPEIEKVIEKETDAPDVDFNDLA